MEMGNRFALRLAGVAALGFGYIAFFIQLPPFSWYDAVFNWFYGWFLLLWNSTPKDGIWGVVVIGIEVIFIYLKYLLLPHIVMRKIT